MAAGRLTGCRASLWNGLRASPWTACSRQLAVDGSGRVSPLVAARLGRDLFDLVARMGYVEGGFVHRDISPRNVMVRTSRLSLEQQVDEGVFDLYLIDFGSSAESEPRSTSFTSENAVFRGATADFAPPEMLSDDIPGLAELRKSPGDRRVRRGKRGVPAGVRAGPLRFACGWGRWGACFAVSREDGRRPRRPR